MKYSEILLEVAGTYGFFRPSDEKEILCNGPYNKEHADYIQDDPAAFGLTQEEVDSCWSIEKDMVNLINLVLTHGWVRVNYYRGAWDFQGFDFQTTKKSLRYYFENHEINEANLEWGPDAAHPIRAISLYPEIKIKEFLRSENVIN
jgi:hypothetical protein